MKNIKIWSFESAKKEAKKYKYRNDFRKGSSGAYYWARKNNKLDEVCSHMKRKKAEPMWNLKSVIIEAKKYSNKSDFIKKSKSASNWAYQNKVINIVYKHMGLSFELVSIEANKYKNRTDFIKNSSREYKWAKKNDVLEEVCSHMKRGKYYFELVKKEASKYNTKKDFRNNSEGFYNWAIRNNCLDEICSHMIKIKVDYFTYDVVKKEAEKYQTRADFSKNFNSGYQWACRNKCIDRVCSHMAKKTIRQYWNIESAKIEAKKYKTRNEFKKKSPSAYDWCRKKSDLDLFCEHMVHSYKIWTFKLALKEAKKYKIRSDFLRYSSKAYDWGRYNNKLDELCAHMERGVSGFNPEKIGYVYYIRIDKEGRTFYKVGITNNSVKDRFRSEFKYINTLYLWQFKNGYDAEKFEREILNDYDYARYKGPEIISSGNTEMFEYDILDLDKEKEVFEYRRDGTRYYG